MTPHILAHIAVLDPALFMPLDDVDSQGTLDAQAATAHEMLLQMGSPEHILDEDRAVQVREVFGKITTIDLKDKERKEAILSLRAPQAVRHLAGMLTQYDWEYVEHAKELRGYVVAKLLEESKHPDAKIRLRSLEMIGKLTEVASFTERKEITIKDASSEELTERIRTRLKSLLPPVMEVQDAEPKDVAAC